MSVGIIAQPWNPPSASHAPTPVEAVPPSSKHQFPADVLIDKRCRIEACRALTSKAAAAIHVNQTEADKSVFVTSGVEDGFRGDEGAHYLGSRAYATGTTSLAMRRDVLI
jgi:hypothetical protein